MSTPDSLYLDRGWSACQDADQTLVHLKLTGGHEEPLLVPCRFLQRRADVWRFDDVPAFLSDLKEPRDLGRYLGTLDPAVGAADLGKAPELPYPALVATSPNGAVFGHTGSTPSTVHARARLEQIVHAFDDAAESVGAETRAFWYLRTEDFPQAARVLEPAGYCPVLLNADSVLDLTVERFDDYLAQLSASRRQAARRELRAFDRAGLRLEVLPADRLTLEMADLHVQLQVRHGRPATADGLVTAVRRLDAQYGQAVRLIVASDAGSAVGFMVVVKTHQRLYCRQVGFLRSQSANRAFAYFNVVFYAAIQLAIEEGLEAVEYGTEAYGAKRGRGCRQRPLLGFLKSHSYPDLDRYLAGYSSLARSYLVDEGCDPDVLDFELLGTRRW